MFLFGKKPVTATNISLVLPGGRTLFQGLDVSVNAKDRIGIIGPEGNGKSLLMKVLAQRLIPRGIVVRGQVSLQGNTIGYLPQTLSPKWLDWEVSDFFILNKPTDTVNYERYNELALISPILSKFGLNPDEFFSKKMGSLSGGERIKIQLAKILASKPDFLFLDEPTNDVDIPFLIWLENFIKSFKGGVVFISHDETFLRNVSTRIIHLEQIKNKTQSRHTIANVGYSQYVNDRARLLKNQKMMALQQRKEQRKLITTAQELQEKTRQAHNGTTDSAVRRTIGKATGRQATKIAQALKRELVEFVAVEEAIKIVQSYPRSATFPNGKQLINISILKLFIPGTSTVLAKNIKLNLKGPQHICIIGKSGSGKTTLLNHFRRHFVQHGMSVAYCPQDVNLLFKNPQLNAIQYLTANGVSVEKVRHALGAMKFIPSEHLLPIPQLSGGQKMKVAILMLLFSGSNILLLDEPTRNLSPLTNPVIQALFSNFPGAIIAVSHDRSFIQNVGKVVYELTPKGLKRKS